MLAYQMQYGNRGSAETMVLKVRDGPFTNNVDYRFRFYMQRVLIIKQTIHAIIIRFISRSFFFFR